MSLEIVNLFTSSANIKKISNELSKLIKDDTAKEAILDTLTESIFDFQGYSFIEDGRLRHSTDIETEIEILNNAFIQDRLAFAKNFKSYTESQEFYADQMFIDDSLSYGNFNTTNNEDEDKRIFRYQDKFSLNRSIVPIWQITNRGNYDHFNDELRESDLSQIRKSSGAIEIDHVKSVPIEIKPKWIDI